MKTLTILFFCIFLTLFAFGQQVEAVRIASGSTLDLKGVSNINSFTCQLPIPPKTLTLGYHHQSDSIVFEENQLLLTVDHFDCENNMMTRDLKKTLKMEEHPYIKLQLLGIGKVNSNKEKVQANMKISIAGVSNCYWLNANIKQIAPTKYRVELKHTFDMNDFEIEPPTALMGLIKVKEDISIDLLLILSLQ